jgi:uncharacterized protein YndB with AHSA1/START domain
MSDAAPDERIVGSLHDTGDGKGTVRVEDVFETDIDDLWSALTDPARLARWIAAVEGDLRLGGQIQARFTSTWEGPGRIDICDAPHHLMVTWHAGTDEETVIEADLTAEGDRTRLVVRDRGIPIDELPFHGAGWQAHLEDLAAEVAGRPASVWRDRWTTLTPLYQVLVARRD